MAGECAVGLDIGGTDTKAALIDLDGGIVARASHPTLPDRAGSVVLAEIANLVAEVIAKAEISPLVVIGLGSEEKTWPDALPLVGPMMNWCLPAQECFMMA